MHFDSRLNGVRHRTICAAACLLALGTARPALAQMQLYRSSLHSHTGFSDGNVFGSGGATAETLATAAAAAKNAGLTCFASSDHGEYLSPSTYASIMQQSQAATVPGLVSTPGSFVALWGFEWTKAALNTSKTINPGTGHISVYGASDRTGAMNNGGGYTNTTVTASVWWQAYNGFNTTDQSLYKWILDHKTSPLGGTIVAQINHPNLYPGATLANPSVLWNETWWKKLEWVPALDAYVTLMEMGSRSEPGASTTGYWGGAYNEPYFQLALDNGWHLGPTNNEDNHTDHYGGLRTSDGILTETGIWSASTAGLRPAQAQAALLGALRFRRVYASEDRVVDALNPHAKAISLKFTVQSPTTGLKWMGWKGLAPADVQKNRCRLEISRGAGLLLTGGTSSVQVITNRGVVAKTLPLSQATVTGNTAVWNFSLPGDQPAAQLRAISTVLPPSMQTQYAAPPLPLPQGGAPLTVVLDASPTGRVERYYYVRVQQSDGTLSYAAPVWLYRGYKVAGGDDGIHPPRAANVVSYTWDFGDGVVETESGSDANAPDGLFDGQTTHKYNATGEYYPRVKVTYADGTFDCAVTRVWVGSGAPTTPLYGDVNGDYQINDEDVSLLMQMASGLAPADSARLTRADVFPPAANDPVKHLPGDKKVTLLDTIRLARFLNGTSKTWP